MFPPIPSWNEMHPLIIHFPIALLLIAPLFVVLSAAFQKQAKTFSVSALILMLIGTVGAFVAVQSGEAASEVAEKAGFAENLIERHEELSEIIPYVFGGLSFVWATITFVPNWIRKPLNRTLSIAAAVAFLLLYSGGAVALVNAAHEGGRLVHEFNIHARMAPTSAQSPSVPAPAERGNDDD